MNIVNQAASLFCQLTRIPVTLSIALAAFAVAIIPAASELLQFDRAQVAAGETFRLATCHITHWNAEHLALDLVMFVALGAVCELRAAAHTRLCVVSSAVAVSMLVFWQFPEITHYRGMSGIDTALFTLFACDMLRDSARNRRLVRASVIGAILFGFAAKTIYEAFTGQAVFVDQAAAGFDIIVWDHLIAAIVGTAIAFLPSPRDSKSRARLSISLKHNLLTNLTITQRPTTNR